LTFGLEVVLSDVDTVAPHISKSMFLPYLRVLEVSY
jgi:hypothetical protein